MEACVFDNGGQTPVRARPSGLPPGPQRSCEHPVGAPGEGLGLRPGFLVSGFPLARLPRLSL